MKEKKYLYERFQNWYEKYDEVIRDSIIVAIILFCIVTIIPGIYKCSNQINYDFPIYYEYLNTAADNICDSDTKTLYLAEKPDDVSVESISYTDGNISFKCELENNKLLVKPAINVKTDVDTGTLIKTPESSSFYYTTFVMSTAFDMTLLVLSIVIVLVLIIGVILLFSFLHRQFDIAIAARKNRINRNS